MARPRVRDDPMIVEMVKRNHKLPREFRKSCRELADASRVSKDTINRLQNAILDDTGVLIQNSYPNTPTNGGKGAKS